jgi:hypothetical protein
MDNLILKKRLNTFKSGKSGRLQDISDDVVVAVHRAWENWPGATADFCKEIGVKPTQMNVIIRSAKKLVKSGVVQESEFKELIATNSGVVVAGAPCTAIELNLSDGKVIRFPQVEQLVDFLKKAA